MRDYRFRYQHMAQTSPVVLADAVLPKVVGSTVADVGCGSGVYGYLMRATWQLTGGWIEERIPAPDRLIGIDFSPAAVDRLRGRGIYDDVILADSSTLPLPDRSVETGLSMENIEHLWPTAVQPALSELARVSRRRIVISTPSPWEVVNRSFLGDEIPAAGADRDPLPYDEFCLLAGFVHVSSVTPDQMAAAGFAFATDRLGNPATECGSMVYTADPDRLDLAVLGPVIGVPWTALPADDGRDDWRSAYVDLLQASLDMPAPRRAPRGARIIRVAAQIRAAARA